MIDIFSEISALPDNFVKELLETYKVPGVAIGAFSEKQKLYIFEGRRDRTGLIDEHTSFRIASLTKPVFAYLCHQLMLDEVFELDVPLVEYYGENHVDHEYIEKLTARHVLSHQSGWPNWAFDKPLEFEFEPGERFQYSGEGITYLQKVVEKLMGDKAHFLVDEKVFQPLGMRSSALTPNYLRTRNKTQPHDKEGMVIERRRNANASVIDYINRMPRESNAAGTMWSSISDYTRFLHHLLFDQEEQTQEILSRLVEPQVTIDKWNASWGLGIGLQGLDDQKAMWHWGDDNGFKAFTITYLEEQTGITVFTNGDNGFEVYARILETVLPNTPEFIKYRKDREKQ